MRHLGRAWLIMALVAGSLALSACAKTSEEPAPIQAAADVRPIGDTGISRITLTAHAVTAIGIRTVSVSKDASATSAESSRTVIPITALVYDPSGKTWVYTMPADRVFVRVPIVIQRMDGTWVHLESGPPVGTHVVTVGSPELLGAEYGVGAE
jgi:hypothetical protein